ncbi:MAG: FAD-dependent oxidoreductase [Proteobacteria bacterium]|nr:FAD-dependent oxidoreductase [Pseudomonadota bacterium]
MADRYDIIVAGSGIAGLCAGLAAARLGRSTLVLAGDTLGGHLLSIEKIDGYPGFPEGVPGYDLCPIAQEQAVEAGAEITMGELTGLEPDPDGWTLTADTGSYSARTVILAMGTSLKFLGVPGEAEMQGKGVSQCASCDAPLLRDKPVVVIGGGDSAMQEALTLAGAASSVVMLVRGDTLSGQASYREQVTAHSKIDIKFGTEIAEIAGPDAVSGVKLSDGSEIEAEGVFIFVGLAANSGNLNGSVELTENGYITTDAALRTSAKGVFAAGTIRAGAPARAAAAAGDGTAAALAADRYLTEGVW